MALPPPAESNGREGRDVTTTPGVGSLGVVNRRVIVWGPDGMPAPSAQPLLTKPGLEALTTVALSLPYKIRDKVPFELTVPLPPDASQAMKNQREVDLQRAEYEWEQDQEFVGLTNAEVMIIRLARAAAEGNLSSIESLLDRSLGRPKQSVETKSLSLTYADVLKEKAARLRETESSAKVTDVEVVEPAAEKPFGELEGLM